MVFGEYPFERYSRTWNEMSYDFKLMFVYHIVATAPAVVEIRPVTNPSTNSPTNRWTGRPLS